MSGYPPPYPPPGYDPRAQRRFLRDSAGAASGVPRARQQMRYQMRSMRAAPTGTHIADHDRVVFLLIETGRIDHSAFWDGMDVGGRCCGVRGCHCAGRMGFGSVCAARSAASAIPANAGGAVVLLLVFVVAGVVARGVHEFPDGTARHSRATTSTRTRWISCSATSTRAIRRWTSPTRRRLADHHESSRRRDGERHHDDNSIHLAIHKQVYASSDSELTQRRTTTTQTNKYRNSAGHHHASIDAPAPTCHHGT